MSSNPVATNHRELITWQRCAQLRGLVLQYTRKGPVREDRRFLSQIRGSARSACNLTSEGFYRKRDGDFINYLVMARASLGEASDQIDDGRDCGYFSAAQRDQMIRILKRAMAANRELRKYLENCREATKRERIKRPQTNGPKDLRT